MESDDELHDCMSEAVVSFMPKQLRSLFVTILVFGEPAQPCMLWEKFKDSMSEDLLKEAKAYLQLPTDELKWHAENEVLLLIQEELESVNTCLQDFGLPLPEIQNSSLKIPKVIQEEMFDANSQIEISEVKCRSFNPDQQKSFCTVMKAIEDEDYPQRVFFLNAPGGYGKTFLIEALLLRVREIGKKVLAVASSGIAAELLEGGRIAHSQFKIPIPVNESSVCSISFSLPMLN